MTPVLARIKRAVREAVSVCGGVDGAGATAERSRSVAGDWNNLNHHAFPPLDCALALDEVSVAQGNRPAILCAYAMELGHVVIRLPDPGVGMGGLSSALIDASAEFGDIATAVREATRDGKVCAKDRAEITHQIDEALQALSRLRVIANTEVEN